MTEEKKIKIGKIANVVSTVLFVMFIIVTFVGINVSVKVFLVLTAAIFILFVISCVVAHVCLKNHKPQ